MIRNVCVVGAGAIGSLFAAHLAKVTEVFAFVRRGEHADALNQHGLRVSGRHVFQVNLTATTIPEELPDFDLGIVSTKATQTEAAFAPVSNHFDNGCIISAQNGLGSEEVLAHLTPGQIIRGTTFMSGTKHSDTHVQYELNTATWLGPFEPSGTPYSKVQEAADLINKSGLRAEALEDARSAQWSKLIFNASVNAVAALTELPHCPLFSRENTPHDLGHLLRALLEEGKSVASAAGVELHEDPVEMNQLGSQTNHPPSMLYDIRNQLKTEVEFLGGAIAREAQRLGVSAPLHTALFQLVKAKETSWAWTDENKDQRK